MSDDGTAHGTDCIGELATLYIQIPNEQVGGWRSRCHHPDCKEMIENNEVQFTVYIKRVDKWNLWKTNHFHLICFIKYLDGLQHKLINEAKKAMALSDELKVMLNEKKLWFRTIPKAVGE